MMETNPLLDTYLRQLRLPTFLKLYSQFATDAARNNQDAVRFLLALAEQEVNQRQHNMLQQRLKTPAFRYSKNWLTLTSLVCHGSTKPRSWIWRAANIFSRNKV